jgi:cell wall assembly regulator SMI1
MDAVQRLQAAVDSRLVDEDGHDVVVELRPPVTEAEVATLQAGFPVPLPAELVQLLAVTRGAEGLLDLDLTGRDHSVELAELMPAGLPIATDGYGNFWVLDLTPDTVEVAPVFFHCHDAPVLLYQAPDLATFLDEVVKRYVPPHASLVDDVREDRPYDVWRARPGAMPQVAALSSPDLALREFAETLDPAWTIVDLRQREVGMGVAWGAHGPRTRLARHGWERIFAYAPFEKPRRTWRRFGRRART